MNKRIQKKKAKQAKQVEQKIPKGYGVITGNDNGVANDYIKHHYPIGSVVKVLDVYSGVVTCRLNGLMQAVSSDHINISN